MSQTDILLESGTNELEVVEFYLDEESPDEGGGVYRGYYGVNVAKVLEIIRLPKITTLPEVPHPSIMGTFNQRSRIIPLVDLAIWLNKPRVEREPPKVVVTEFNSVTTAFLVSGVNRIHRKSWEDVEPPGKYVAAVSRNTLTGVVKLEGRIAFLLDLEKIVFDLSPETFMSLDKSMDLSSEHRYRALVADDSGVIREMLRNSLHQANFHVETVSNGREAWDRLQEIRGMTEQGGKGVTDYLNVLVSDIEMPGMDGHNLTKRVKDDAVLKGLPVILFSSLITDKLRHKGEQVGADDQISKPNITELVIRAKALIEAGSLA